MPKKGEKQRKISAIKAGKPVKAPKGYWDKIFKETKKEYPKVSLTRQRAITGTRWKKISKPEKIKIVKKFQK